MKNRYNDTVFSPGGTLESGHIRGNEVLFSEDLRDERGQRRKLRNTARNDFTRYYWNIITLEGVIVELDYQWIDNKN